MSDTNKRTIRTKKMILPIVPLRGLAVFPYMVLHFDVIRDKSINAIEKAMADNTPLFLVSQIMASVDDPEFCDLYSFGTIARVKQILKLPNGGIRVLVEGICRGRLAKIISDETCIIGEVRQYPAVRADYTVETEALVSKAKKLFDEFVHLTPNVSKDTILSVMSIKLPGELSDVIAGNVFSKLEDKQDILCEYDPIDRINKLIEIMYEEIQILSLEQDIAFRVKEAMDKNQKEYYLREQMKIIKEELGETDGIDEVCDLYRLKLYDLKLPREYEDKLLREIDRLSKMPHISSDASVQRNYLDTVFELPWNILTKDNLNIDKIQSVLDADHYGLEKVKERITEFFAVKQLSKEAQSPILCLVGPPGVGKTSIVSSIARATGRKFVRISLGGIRDEAEIRGHRKTYVGAMPGRIINAIKQAGTKNPVVLLDEIDKMTSDMRGDPASALLEVLDYEQNQKFRDHYVEVPFDLSNVMFVTTANTVESISRPLLDRMEIIELSSYLPVEKFEIAKRYLLPKQRKKHGLNGKTLKIADEVLKDIITYYTRESGVRNLERKIAQICRKAAKIIVEGTGKSVSVNSLNLEHYLGKKIYISESLSNVDEVGYVNGLAWTQVGGEMLTVEVNIMDGSGKLELTGSLGDVMKESATAAVSYIRANYKQYNIDKDFYKTKDIHIHVPDGATPKDGPSAGITMATAVISALTGIKVRHDVAMTGEISIRGKVLPIGGLKEKSMAAHREKMKTVIIPTENVKDLDEIPNEIKECIDFLPVKTIAEVLKIAFVTENNDNDVFLGNVKSTNTQEAGIVQ